jgi:hypothetical protein
VRPEELCQRKNPVTPSGIEPANKGDDDDDDDDNNNNNNNNNNDKVWSYSVFMYCE